MSTYEQSSNGYQIVVIEATEQLPVLRVVFIALITLLALALKFNESLIFWSIRLDPKQRTHRVFNWFYLFYAIHSILFIGMAVDTIARPVQYHELKLLYQKYVLSTMEIPTLIIICVILLGFHSFTKMLFSAAKSEQATIHQSCLLTLTYIILSLLPLLRYRVSPPMSFTTSINLVVMSCAVSAMALTIAVIVISHMNSRNTFANNSNRDSNNLLNISVNYSQNSDDEEIETYSRVKVKNARQRTPTKITPV